jgi:TAP-like protein
VYAGVECTDAQWPTNWDRWRTDNWRTFRKAPFETWGNAWFNAPCVYWPAKAHRPVEIDGRHVASVLLIDETLDAATPFEGSLEVRRRYPHASLIAEPGGTTHAGSLGGNACVDNQIAAYLATGKLPKRLPRLPRLPGNRADTLCDPLPQPDPTAPAAAAATAGPTGSARLLPERPPLAAHP